jgi:P-type Ca2+ transporter type 2C
MNLHQDLRTMARVVHPGDRERAAYPSDGSAKPHSSPAEDVIAALGSDHTRGLSRNEVDRRLDQYGPNQLKSAPEIPWWRRLLEQFKSFLVIILLVAQGRRESQDWV